MKCQKGDNTPGYQKELTGRRWVRVVVVVNVKNERQKSDGGHRTKAIDLDKVNGEVYDDGKCPRHIDRRAKR